MLKVLWIEDVPGNIEEYTNDDFDELFDIIVPDSFEKTCRYAVDSLEYDFVIIDINLEKFSDFDCDYVKESIRQLIPPFTKESAGIAVFNMLILYGFPKDRMLFLTAQASHAGDKLNTYGMFKVYFDSALMPLPEYILKSDDSPEKLVCKLKERINPYITLRRGIIDGCRQLTKLRGSLRFSEFIGDKKKKNSFDIDHYLYVLENFLPLREKSEKNNSILFNIFIKTLAHEWDVFANPQAIGNDKAIFAFSQIMKYSRNWSSHSKVFSKLTEKDVAYLFIVNMRAMFELGGDLLSYEKHLLSLSKEDVVDVNEMKKIIGKDCNDRKIPLAEKYKDLLKIHSNSNSNEALKFHKMLDDLHKIKEKSNNFDGQFFIIGLYQIFWFVTSNSYVHIPPSENNNKINCLYYCFDYFDYTTQSYLFELASHIYKRSFPEKT